MPNYCIAYFTKEFNANYHDLGQTDKFGLASFVKEFVDTNKLQITLFELEGIIQYNGTYLNQLFKKKYQRSITDYNQNTYLQHMAKLLLAQIDPLRISITQLGLFTSAKILLKFNSSQTVHLFHY